jgi:hypothetical protein
MHCPRLDHFVRLNQDGSVGKCGHMVDAKGFKALEELEHSEWLKSVKDTMSQGKWPAECTMVADSGDLISNDRFVSSEQRVKCHLSSRVSVRGSCVVRSFFGLLHLGIAIRPVEVTWHEIVPALCSRAYTIHTYPGPRCPSKPRRGRTRCSCPLVIPQGPLITQRPRSFPAPRPERLIRPQLAAHRPWTATGGR